MLQELLEAAISLSNRSGVHLRRVVGGWRWFGNFGSSASLSEVEEWVNSQRDCGPGQMDCSNLHYGSVHWESLAALVAGLEVRCIGRSKRSLAASLAPLVSLKSSASGV